MWEKYHSDPSVFKEDYTTPTEHRQLLANVKL